MTMLFGKNMKKLLLLFLLVPTLSFAVEINLSCQVEAVFENCGTESCREKVESGAADISVIDLKHKERILIVLRLKDDDCIFNIHQTLKVNTDVDEYVHNEREWIIADTYSSDALLTTSRIEINRYTGKVYLKKKMLFSDTASKEVTVSGDCTKDDVSKQRY